MFEQMTTEELTAYIASAWEQGRRARQLNLRDMERIILIERRNAESELSTR